MRRTFPILALATLFASAPLFAQQTQPATQPATQPKEGSVNDRRQDQQGRIANGVQSGQLTAGETKKLEGREANVNREIKDDRQANGGKLTTQERRQVNRQQNNMSKSMYNDKHNANTAHYGNNEVGQRRENQQDRVAQGIKSGQMTAGEAARTENREQGINRQIHADRQANDGRLTGQERRQVNREQNRTSRQIYRQKHNNRVAPK
jgi:predicted transglutaminase-like cysteine proteinase